MKKNILLGIIILVILAGLLLWKSINKSILDSKTIVDNTVPIAATNNNPLNTYSKVYTGKWLEYTNPVCNFSLQYPDNWTVDADQSTKGCNNFSFLVHSSTISDLKGFEGKAMQYMISFFIDSKSGTTIVSQFIGVRSDVFAFPVTYDKTQYQEYKDGQKIIQSFKDSLSPDNLIQLTYMDR